MTFLDVYRKVVFKKALIMKQLSGEIKIIKNDYIDEIREDWKAEDSDELFNDYLNYYIDDHIDYALIPYILDMIKDACDLSNEDLESLSTAEKDALALEFIIFFKEKSKLGTIFEE